MQILLIFKKRLILLTGQYWVLLNNKGGDRGLEVLFDEVDDYLNIMKQCFSWE